jgi:apolipoprotein N-acyltransferase
LLVALSTGRRVSLTRAFGLGLTTGIVYFTATLYWITLVVRMYGDLPIVVAMLVNALLVAYLALFPALFAVIMRRLWLAYRAPVLMAAPLVWTATELGRTYLLFNGFPWVLLGYSQATTLPIAQLASVFGVYGVSAVVASVSAAAATCVATRSLRHRFTAVGAVAVIVVVTAAWGSVRANRAELTREGQPVKVGLVQGNVSEAQRLDPAQAQRILQDHARLTRQAIGAGAELVLWAESSMTPYRFADNADVAGLVRRVARESRVPILVGSDQVERGHPDKWYNSAFLVRADGTDAGVYRKMHLVPFGEYVPMKRLLFFIGPLVKAIGTGFDAGEDPTVLPVDGHAISVAICYEIVYPALIRQFVLRGSELLTTITNDAWFGNTSAPYQHFAQASMRAIEEGRYVVRAANTGISGIVDPYGRVLERTDIFERGMIVGQARFLTATTAYAKWGDVFAYAASVITAVLLLVARRHVQYKADGVRS